MSYSNLDDYDLVEFQGENLRETELAVLFELEESGEEVWIPKSCMEDWPEEGDQGTILVQEWFVIKEGLV